MAGDAQAPSDADLARQTQAGSVPAFEQLVSRYEQRIFAFASTCCHNPSDAREITQDTFLKVFHSIAQFNPRHSFSSWLFTIARRKCIDHHRRVAPFAGEPLPDLADPEDPAQVVARQEAKEDLWRLARHSLSELQFQALWLRYAEDLDVVETARVLGKTVTHTKVLLFRARQHLGRALKQAPPQGTRHAVKAALFEANPPSTIRYLDRCEFPIPSRKAS